VGARPRCSRELLDHRFVVDRLAAVHSGALRHVCRFFISILWSGEAVCSSVCVLDWMLRQGPPRLRPRSDGLHRHFSSDGVISRNRVACRSARGSTPGHLEQHLPFSRSPSVLLGLSVARIRHHACPGFSHRRWAWIRSVQVVAYSSRCLTGKRTRSPYCAAAGRCPHARPIRLSV
jgi:hypothetical protein